MGAWLRENILNFFQSSFFWLSNERNSFKGYAIVVACKMLGRRASVDTFLVTQSISSSRVRTLPGTGYIRTDRYATSTRPSYWSNLKIPWTGHKRDGNIEGEKDEGMRKPPFGLFSLPIVHSISATEHTSGYAPWTGTSVSSLDFICSVHLGKMIWQKKVIHINSSSFIRTNSIIGLWRLPSHVLLVQEWKSALASWCDTGIWR